MRTGASHYKIKTVLYIGKNVIDLRKLGDMKNKSTKNRNKLASATCKPTKGAPFVIILLDKVGMYTICILLYKIIPDFSKNNFMKLG